MPGGEGHGLPDVAVCQWDVRGGRRTQCGGHAGDDFKWDTGLDEGFGFFTATPEQARITALQPADTIARAGQTNQRFVDRFLSRGTDAVATLSDVEHDGTGAGFAQQFGCDQRIVQNDVGRLQAPQTAERDQIR